MEKQSFSPSLQYQIFEWKDHKAALLICYDIEFPQHCRALAEQGVSILFVPTTNPKGYEHVSKILVPARASEMGVTIIYANYCGSEQGLAYAGLSTVVGPDGNSIVSAGRQPSILITEIDLTATHNFKAYSTQQKD